MQMKQVVWTWALVLSWAVLGLTGCVTTRREANMYTTVSLPAENASSALEHPVVKQARHQWPKTLTLKRHRGFLFARVSINSSDTAWFLIDTGCNQDIVDTEVATDWRLPICGAGYAMGAGGRQDARYHLIKRIDLEGVRLNATRIASMDLSRFSDVFGMEVSGIISFNSLKQWPFTIDQTAGSLTFHDPEQPLPGGLGESIPFREIEGLPIVAMQLANRRWVSLVVDSGGDQAMVLPTQSLSRWPELFDQSRVQTASLAAIGGDVLTQKMTIDQVTLLGRTFKNTPVSLETRPAGFNAGRAMIGRLGHPILERCTLTFDSASQRVYVKWK